MKEDSSYNSQVNTQTYTQSNQNGGGLSKWLKDNAWNLLVTGWMVGAGVLFLQFRVSSIEKAQAQFEKNLEEYPSVDYFNEKFKVLEEADKRQIEATKDVKISIEKHIELYNEFITNIKK